LEILRRTPNSVLRLLVDCKVALALPFAYYRACIAGDPASLSTTVEGAALPPNTLMKALRGQERLKKEGMQLATELAFRNCTAWGCYGTIASNRAQVFDWILPEAGGGILERGDFPGSNHCAKCKEAFAQGLAEAKVKTWENLTEYFGLPSWGYIGYQPNRL
jgi:hypothetical protein